MKRVKNEWYVGWNSSSSYIHDSAEWEWDLSQQNNYPTVFTRDDNLVIRTFQRNGTHYSGKLISRQVYTPSHHEGELKCPFV